MGWFSQDRKARDPKAEDKRKARYKAARDEWMMHRGINFPLYVKLPLSYLPKVGDSAGQKRTIDGGSFLAPEMEMDAVNSLRIHGPARLTWVDTEVLPAWLGKALAEDQVEPDAAEELEEPVADATIWTEIDQSEKLWEELEEKNFVGKYALARYESQYVKWGIDELEEGCSYIGEIEIPLDMRNYYRTNMEPGWDCDYLVSHCISFYTEQPNVKIGNWTVQVLGMFMDYAPLDGEFADLPVCRTLRIYTKPIQPVTTTESPRINRVRLYCESPECAVDLIDLKLSVYRSNCRILKQFWTDPYDTDWCELGGWETLAPKALYREELRDPVSLEKVERRLGLIRTVILGANDGFKFDGDPGNIDIVLNDNWLKIDQRIRYYPEILRMLQGDDLDIDHSCAVWLVPSEREDGKNLLCVRFVQRSAEES